MAMVGLLPGPLGVSTDLIADRRLLSDAVLQHQVGEIGDTVFDGVVEKLELGVGLGRPFTQSGDV